jgi:hypothetical protein
MSAVTPARADRGAETSGRRRRATGWLGRLGALCFGLLVSLAAVEIVLRLLGPYLPIVNSLTSIATFQTYHPVYGFFHRPGASGWIETPEFTSYVSFNANGLRDREMPVAKPPGTYRVLLLGDSFVEGAQVPAEDTVSRQLMNLLQGRLPGRSVDTVNAGNAGFGTAQELLYLEHDGAAYQSDLVMLVYFIDNDLPDNGYRVARDRKLDTTRRPFFVPDGHGGIELRPGLAPPEDRFAAVRPWLRRLVSYNLIENFMLWHEAREQEQAQIGKNRPTYLVDPPEIWNEAWWVTEQLLGRVRDTARSQGAELVVVAAPAYYQVNADAWRALVAGDTREENRYEQDAPNRRLAGIAERQGLRLLDLLPSVRQAQQGGARLYYPADGHWTSDGHRFAASQIAEYLTSSGLIPRP